MLAAFHWGHGAYEGCSRGLWRLLGHAHKTCFIALGANSCMISSSQGHSQGNSKTTRTITPPAHAIDGSRKLAVNSLAGGAWPRPRHRGHGRTGLSFLIFQAGTTAEASP